MWGPDIHVSFNKWSEAGPQQSTDKQTGTSKNSGVLAAGWDGAIVGSKCWRKRGKEPVVPYRNVITRQPLLQQQVSHAYSSVLGIYPYDEKDFNHMRSLCCITLTVTLPSLQDKAWCFVCACVVWFALYWWKTAYLMTPILVRTFSPCFYTIK